MHSAKSLKEKVFRQLHVVADKKIQEIQNAIGSAKDSRDTEDKNTAGDKHETARAMMQIEMENLDAQLNSAYDLKKVILRININGKPEKAAFGSLVSTNHGFYFISAGLGKVKVDDEVVFAVSVASPIGQALIGKAAGEKFVFQGREFELREVA